MLSLITIFYFIQTNLRITLHKMANDTDSNGITGGHFDVYGANRLIPRALTAFTAIARYNSVEILILIFFIFKRYSGLYFWSLIFSALSIIPYATGRKSSATKVRTSTDKMLQEHG